MPQHQRGQTSIVCLDARYEVALAKIQPVVSQARRIRQDRVSGYPKLNFETGVRGTQTEAVRIFGTSDDHPELKDALVADAGLVAPLHQLRDRSRGDGVQRIGALGDPQ